MPTGIDYYKIFNANMRLINKVFLALAALSSTAIAQVSHAAYTQEFSGRTPEDIQKKAIQNGFSYPSNAVECNKLMCYQKWSKE